MHRRGDYRHMNVRYSDEADLTSVSWLAPSTVLSGWLSGDLRIFYLAISPILPCT